MTVLFANKLSVVPLVAIQTRVRVRYCVVFYACNKFHPFACGNLACNVFADVTQNVANAKVVQCVRIHQVVDGVFADGCHQAVHFSTKQVFEFNIEHFVQQAVGVSCDVANCDVHKHSKQSACRCVICAVNCNVVVTFRATVGTLSVPQILVAIKRVGVIFLANKFANIPTFAISGNCNLRACSCGVTNNIVGSIFVCNNGCFVNCGQLVASVTKQSTKVDVIVATLHQLFDGKLGKCFQRAFHFRKAKHIEQIGKFCVCQFFQQCVKTALHDAANCHVSKCCKQTVCRHVVGGGVHFVNGFCDTKGIFSCVVVSGVLVCACLVKAVFKAILVVIVKCGVTSVSTLQVRLVPSCRCVVGCCCICGFIVVCRYVVKCFFANNAVCNGQFHNGLLFNCCCKVTANNARGKLTVCISNVACQVAFYKPNQSAKGNVVVATSDKLVDGHIANDIGNHAKVGQSKRTKNVHKWCIHRAIKQFVQSAFFKQIGNFNSVQLE